MVSEQNERGIIALVGAVQFINTLDFMMVMPLAPDFAESLNIPPSSIGIIGGSYTLAAACAGIIASFFLDRFDVLIPDFTPVEPATPVLHRPAFVTVDMNLFEPPVEYFAPAPKIGQYTGGDRVGRISGCWFVHHEILISLACWNSSDQLARELRRPFNQDLQHAPQRLGSPPQ